MTFLGSGQALRLHSQRKRLQDFWLTPLPGFVARTAEFVFHFFNQAWESWSKTITTRHRGVLVEGHLARAMVIVQDQNMELEISMAQVAKLEKEKKAVEKVEK
ncbi:hypothetical protein Fot_32649 [Forsythia ovata]|uniref:Uncharacterized protein n=1 Tax=Forsythia ovata TaxID=205694 RepID=A0ABD1T8F2_9LAMI